MAEFESAVKGDEVVPTTTTLTPLPSSLPAVLILGGCGCIGRNLVHHLVSGNLAMFIKVADKAMPEMSYFHDMFVESFQSPIVQYEQNDLTKYVKCSLINDVHCPCTTAQPFSQFSLLV